MNEVTELLRLAHYVEAASKPNIQAMYRKFNHSVFGGELPDDLPIKWFKSKTAAGVCHGIWRRFGGSEATKIRISEYIAGDENVVEGVMLHEMVHAYCFVKDLDKGHGHMFNAMRRKFGNKAGVVIPLKEQLDHFVVPESVKIRPMGVIVLDRGSRTGIATFNGRWFKSNLETIIVEMELYANHYARRGGRFDVNLYMVELKELQVYPEKRSIRSFGTYKVDQSLLDDIRRKGKIMGTISAEDFKEKAA